MLRGLLASMAFCSLPAFALNPDRALTQYVHRIWQTQQGLPDGAIVRVIQSKSGYLWLATENGTVRFDGVRFTPVERLMPGAPISLYVRAADEDASGTLWLGGNDSAVYAIRPEGTTKYTMEQGLPGGLTQCVVPEKNGVVWVCMERGLARIDPSQPSKPIQTFRASDGLASDNARTVCENPNGDLWIGGDTPNITLRTSAGFSIQKLKGLPPAASVRALICDGNVLWVGTTFGLIRVEGSEQRLFTTSDGLVDNFVFALSKGASGLLWIGTRSGFSRLRDGAFDSFRPQDGLSQSTVQAVLEDREGSLWVGTKRGLNQFVDGRGVPYTAREGLPSDRTGPVLQDGMGIIWTGTLDAGLARFDGRLFTKLTTSQGLPSNEVRALVEDDAHSLWVGTSKGLARVAAGQVASIYTASMGLPSSDIRSLYRDHTGTIWAGTAAGLASFQKGRFVAESNAPAKTIRSIGQDRSGDIVVATDEGLYIGKNGMYRPLTPGGVYLRNANAFFLDRDGLLWVGLNGAGLRLIDGNKVTTFLTRDGLYDAEIYGIASDDQDRLWMACSRGIFWVPRAELRRFAAGEIESVKSAAYSPTDALRVIESQPGVQPALWRMRDGRMWFATVRGVIALDPTQPQREGSPPVVIEDPIVNGQSTPPQRVSQLPGGLKNVQLNYAGLSYLLPELIRFRYRLNGYDPDWIDAGTRREAFYTNLPPGGYRFQVTACNFEGACNEAGAAMEFTLSPLFYQHAWFWPLMLLATGALGWLGYQLHIRRLRERYDLIVSERSRIARELHDTLIQGFSGITMALQALAARVRTPEEKETLQDIISDAATCLRETRQSVAGLRAVRSPESGLAGAVDRAVREITETKAVRTKLQLDPVLRPLPQEMEYNLLRIVREAVTNAVKHSGANLIEVTLRSKPDAIEVSIHDDGSGFSRDGATGGPGHYGLIGMKERASQIGGTLELVTQPGAGTTISLTLPLGSPAGRPAEVS
ncbi:MAG: two-component regulator propeller domain-containing protein [Acidobacteriota bacterium]